ncbi:uncharacterized protein LOC134185668 isoform X2 [Corticium candelabrum]|uniref:uncharacterized protein LOC134185668 isoform X2 n=1 Tax=Corticium candelabrum TaxID=121492 RepID=UPI002E2765B9|nr:uncharacterized protein LOC134185668 isoform X2 [Corticium candelabrum]
MSEERLRKLSDVLLALSKESVASKLTDSLLELAKVLQEQPELDDACRNLLHRYAPRVERLVKKAMDEHQSDRDMQEASCLVISELTTFSEDLRDRIANEEIFCFINLSGKELFKIIKFKWTRTKTLRKSW